MSCTSTPQCDGPDTAPYRTVRLGRLLAVVAVVVLALTAPAAARDRLVLDQARVPGWHRMSLTAHSIAHVFGVTLPRGTRVDVAAARSRGLTLRSAAFSLRSARAASRLDAGWVRAHRARLVNVGVGGHFAQRRVGRGERLQVVWRRGARIGLLVLDVSGRPRNPVALALGWARLADTSLRTPGPSDAWQRVLAEIRPNGSFSPATAFHAFEVSYGIARGPRPRSLFSGSLAAAMVLRDLRHLSAAQRHVVERRLGVHPPRRHVRAGTAAAAPDYGDGTFTYDGVYTALARHWATLFTPKVRHPLRLKIIVGRSTEVASPDQMDTVPVADTSGTDWDGGAGFCRIRIGPLGLAVSPLDRGWVLAHEVFHCFEMDIAQQNWVYMPPWLLEGMAEWAGLAIDPVASAESIKWINEYIDTPHTPLFERTYDATGFFGHVQDVTGNFWARVDPTILAPTQEAAYVAAGGRLDSVLATWGSSVFRVTSLGAPWEMLSPIVPLGFDQKAPGELGIVPGQVQAPALTTAQYVLDVRGEPPLIHFSIPSHARLEWHHAQYTDLHNAWFCSETAAANACRCPPGTIGTTPPTLPIGGGAILGVTGDPGGNVGSVSAHSIVEFCHAEPHPRPPAGRSGSGGLGCSSTCGSSNGDPHLQTFDGYSYDFQAAGEFTAVKSTTDDLEIQERQEPFGSLSATVDTAVAMRVAGTRVEVDRGIPVRVLINGSQTVVGSAARTLPHGGTIARVGDETVIVWPDGTQAQVWGVGPWGVAYLIEPAATRAGHLVGLLGRFDGDLHHLAGRDGHVYNVAALEGRGGKVAKYHHFGESWRIRSTASLFTYPRGRSTGAYTDRRVPQRILSVGTLSAGVRGAAARTCRHDGISKPLILRDCVLDLAVTHKPAFAAGGATLQRTVGEHHHPTPPPTDRGSEQFQTTCFSDGNVVPAGTTHDVPPGTSAGIVADLEPSVDGARTVIHWTAPPGAIDEPTSEGDSVFADLEMPGSYSVYVTYDGDSTHTAARSPTCTWNVTG